VKSKTSIAHIAILSVSKGKGVQKWKSCKSQYFLPISIMYNCSNLLDMRNLQEQVKKTFCYQKLFCPFTVWMNCSNDLKNFANSQPSALNFKSFPQPLEQFFLTVCQNNFGNKIWLFVLSKIKNMICIEITRTIYSNSGIGRSEQFLATEYFLNLFLELYHI
jgi:hypothetical protein